MANRFVINEELLSQIETLQIILKNNAAGMFGGMRRSKNYGSSCEFADYRDYMPGDDIMKIDWNAYARFEKLYQKLYFDERQMHTRIYIDASRSMQYGDEKKAEQALRLAATIAYLSVCEMDKVSIYVIREGSAESIISSIVGKEAYLSEIGKLNAVDFEGDSHISRAILPSKVGMGDGLSVIISDFMTENNFEDAIDFLVDRKRDVLCMQVMTREEQNPQIRGKMHLFDSEDASRFYRKNIDKEIVRAYKEALAYVKSRISDYCRSRGADYMFVCADDTVSEIFFEKLVNTGVLK
ncbi:MAG: DUF58 domain-containing protein [Eubacteriales bacterium]